MLGPLLFIIYINDLPLLLNNNTNIKLTVYADDTAITFTGINNAHLKHTINNTITKIKIWYIYNKLKININKTKILNCNSSKYININLQINKSLMTNVYEYKYLVIIIDNNLNFKNYIKTLNIKLSKILYSINKLSKYINTKDFAKQRYNTPYACNVI